MDQMFLPVTFDTRLFPGVEGNGNENMYMKKQVLQKRMRWTNRTAIR